MVKVISYYLPQFHSIPENDAVWGKGFTEWNNVKAAKPYFQGHNQPRVPLNSNYYNLLNENTIAWQAKLAQDNGIYGWCIYHYWFSDKILLNKPLELLHRSDNIHMPYCICWANESWTNAWVSSGKPESFLKQEYGDKAEWKRHFEYLLQFFADPDYINENGCPLVVIYRPENIPNLNSCLDYWTELAVQNGLPGLTFAFQAIDFSLQLHSDASRFTYDIEYQPKYALHDLALKQLESSSFSDKLKHSIKSLAESSDNIFHTRFLKKTQTKMCRLH